MKQTNFDCLPMEDMNSGEIALMETTEAAINADWTAICYNAAENNISGSNAVHVPVIQWNRSGVPLKAESQVVRFIPMTTVVNNYTTERRNQNIFPPTTINNSLIQQIVVLQNQNVNNATRSVPPPCPAGCDNSPAVSTNSNYLKVLDQLLGRACELIQVSQNFECVKLKHDHHRRSILKSFVEFSEASDCFARKYRQVKSPKELQNVIHLYMRRRVQSRIDLCPVPQIVKIAKYEATVNVLAVETFNFTYLFNLLVDKSHPCYPAVNFLKDIVKILLESCTLGIQLLLRNTT